MGFIQPEETSHPRTLKLDVIHVGVCVATHLDLSDLLRLPLDAAVVMDDANATHELWGKTNTVTQCAHTNTHTHAHRHTVTLETP